MTEIHSVFFKKQPNGTKRYIIYYYEERGNGRQTAKTDKLQKMIKAKLLTLNCFSLHLLNMTFGSLTLLHLGRLPCSCWTFSKNTPHSIQQCWSNIKCTFASPTWKVLFLSPAWIERRRKCKYFPSNTIIRLICSAFHLLLHYLLNFSSWIFVTFHLLMLTAWQWWPYNLNKFKRDILLSI